MGRIRFIKPDFFTDDSIVELNLITRLVFIGLWTIADREGRIENKPRQIKMKLFPADDDVDIVTTLHELSRNGFIRIYTVEDREFIEIKNFAKHQRIHPNEAKSTLPTPLDSRNVIENSSGITSSSSSTSTSTVGSSDAAGAAVTDPATDLKKPENGNGIDRNAAVAVYEEIFGPPKLELATSIAMTVTDLGVWHELITEKAGWSNPEKWIIKAYRERIAESPPPDTPKPEGKVKTAREFARELREAEEREQAELAAANGTS